MADVGRSVRDEGGSVARQSCISERVGDEYVWHVPYEPASHRRNTLCGVTIFAPGFSANQMPTCRGCLLALERFIGVSYRYELGTERQPWPHDLGCMAVGCDEAVAALGTDGTPIIPCPRCGAPMTEMPYGRAVPR